MATRKKTVSLEVIDQKLDALTEIVRAHVEKDEEKFDKIFMDNGKPSVFSRLKTLEDSEGRRQSHIKYLWTSLCSLVIGLLLKWAN